MQAGKVNSIAALHDARSKQVLNPLKMRKAPQGNAANPVIRQRSVAQQAHHKQHFADTLRHNSDWEAMPAADQPSMHSGQSVGTPDSQQQQHQQQQAQDGAGLVAAHYREHLEPHGHKLASSKSEPHGQFTLCVVHSTFPQGTSCSRCVQKLVVKWSHWLVLAGPS